MPRDGNTHETLSVRKDRKATKRAAKTDAGSSPSDPIASPSPGMRRKQTRSRSKTVAESSVSATIGQVSPDKAGGDGHSRLETQTVSAIAAIVSELVSLQSMRKFCIKSQSRMDRSMESLIASTIGYRNDAEEIDRKTVFANAKKIRLGVEKGGDHSRDDNPGGPVAALSPLILASAQSRAIWDKHRTDIEKQMRALVVNLPVYNFAKGVKGFGDLGLAIICGEAGIPLGEYRTVSGLWKRMGLAVIGGERQRKKTDKEQAALHGYSPMRRAEIWAICSDSMFRHQWRGANEETGEPARPIGPYGEVYGRRRAATEQRIEATADLPPGSPDKWSKARCHNDGRRVMTKALLKDLWVEWRR